jgi:FkbM family methyltransferase
MAKQYSESILKNIKKVSDYKNLPTNHHDYLVRLKHQFDFYPTTIYDIGACVLHWTQRAEMIWPDSEIVLFDATDAFENLYLESGLQYFIGALSNESGKQIKFYQNNENFAGNSYYRENPKYSPAAEYLFDDKSIVEMTTTTIDDLVKYKMLNKPQLIKIDVQGAELDVLMGATESLKSCEHLIVELRDVEYNIGSPEKEVIIDYLASQGFKSMGMFCDNGPDGDYHFMR